MLTWIENSPLGFEQIHNIGFNEEIVRLFKRAIELAKYSECGSDLLISGILYHILGLLISEIENKDLYSDINIQLVEKSKIIMNETVDDYLDCKDFTRTLDVNYSTFRKNFKELSGSSPKQYFLRLKINRAKQLLFETSFPIKQIAYKLGFSSSEHFISTFKHRIGYSPKQYRELCRKN